MCSRGKGGGCRAVTLPDQEQPPEEERQGRDLFGRRVVELVGEIERQKRRLVISEAYRGNEGIALNQERMRSNIRVDERQLALLRGEQVRYDEPIRHFTSAQVDRWREEIERLSRSSSATRARPATKG